MKKLHRSISLYPQVWRVRYYGLKGDDEGEFVVLVVAPHAEDVFKVIRHECDDAAIILGINVATAYFSQACFVDEPLLKATPAKT